MTHLYLARMDVTPSFLPTFEQWYDERHAPDLLKSGFFSCSAFYATEGSPLVHNVYLIPSPEIFQSPTYLGARDPKIDTLRPTVLENVSNRSNTPYEQVVVLRGAPSDLPLPEPAMALQFEWIGSMEALMELFHRLFQSSEETTRLCRRDGTHINVSTEPEWLIFAERATDSTRRALHEFAAGAVSGQKFQQLEHRATFAR